MNPRKANPALPKWIFNHNPEDYAYENYEKVVQLVQKNIPLDEDTDVPPNYPPGYKYQPWNIEKIMDDMRNERPFDLGPGDWS